MRFNSIIGQCIKHRILLIFFFTFIEVTLCARPFANWSHLISQQACSIIALFKGKEISQAPTLKFQRHWAPQIWPLATLGQGRAGPGTPRQLPAVERRTLFLWEWRWSPISSPMTSLFLIYSFCVQFYFQGEGTILKGVNWWLDLLNIQGEDSPQTPACPLTWPSQARASQNRCPCPATSGPFFWHPTCNTLFPTGRTVHVK